MLIVRPATRRDEVRETRLHLADSLARALDCESNDTRRMQYLASFEARRRIAAEGRNPPSTVDDEADCTE
jgi:hypothetical protein